MTFLRIGEFNITKKRFFIFLFVLFIVGILIGGLFMASSKKPNLLLLTPIILAIFFIGYSFLKKETNTK